MRDRMAVDNHLACITLTRGREHYVFRYEEGREAELFSALIDTAQDEDLNFTWLDVLLVLHGINS